MGFSIPHLLVVLAIVILVFGTKRLTSVGSDLGGAIKGFKNALNEDEQLLENNTFVKSNVSTPTQSSDHV